MTRAQMNWKIVRSIIPIIGLWIIANSAKNLKEDYEPTEPLLKISASDLAWRFQVNEGANLVGKTIEIFGEITLIDSTNIVIDKKVFFSKDLLSLDNIKIGDQIQLQARCANFLEQYGLCKIDHVSLIEE